MQEDMVLNEHDPPQIVKAGELFCDAKCHNPVLLASWWCTPNESETTTTVVFLQQVFAADLELLPMSTTNSLPNCCDVQTAKSKKAMSVSKDNHEEILEEINRRNMIDYDELSSDEEVETDDESSDEDDF